MALCGGFCFRVEVCGLLCRVFFSHPTSEISVESPVLLALGFSFYFWKISCPFIPFLDKRRVSNLLSCSRVQLLGWLIRNLIATHFTLAMYVVAPVIPQFQNSWVGETNFGEQTVGSAVIPLEANQ